MNGATVLGLNAGSIEAGKAADLVLLEGEGRFPDPVDSAEALSYVVYLAGRDRVRDVMVDGRLVVENGTLKSMDVAWLREHVLTLREEIGHEESGN